MQKKLMALMVTAAITLSSTVAFATDTEPKVKDLIYQNNLTKEIKETKETKEAQNLKLLLRPSLGIECNDENIIALAESLTASSTDDYSRVKAVYDWICTNIYYDYDERDALYAGMELTVSEERALQSAVTTLNTKKGTCGGYVNLSCALLRAAGIPSRPYNSGPHAYTLAYISSIERWIILDTTSDSIEKRLNPANPKDYVRDQFANSNSNYISGLGYNLDTSKPAVYFKFKEASMGKDVKQDSPFPMTIEGVNKGHANYYSYVSSNPKVATINQYGEISTHAYGTTTISFALLDGSGLIASYVLTVEPRKLEFISLPQKLTLGDSYIVKALIARVIVTTNTAIENKYSYSNIDIENKYIKWSSSSPKVATVDKDGKVTAVGSGTANITATYTDDGLVSSVTEEVSVRPILTGIALSPKTLTVPLNSPILASLTVNDLSGNKLYGTLNEWTSSNPEVATVSSGYVRALKEGTTVITMRTHLSNTVNGKLVKGGQVSDTCIVTVVNTQVVTTPVVKTYTITFNSQGGTAVKTSTVNANSTVTKPTAPTRKGYKFVGWFKDSKCTKAWNFATDKVTGIQQFMLLGKSKETHT